MGQKNHVDAVDMITSFRQSILEHKPAPDTMYQEVRMMKFKVRPLQGDIGAINLKDSNFIEILWSLGKLDEFYHGCVEKISQTQQETFFRLVDEMYDKFQQDLNMLDLKSERYAQSASSFEMEIFKDTKQLPS